MKCALKILTKNHAHVAVCTDADDVDAVLADMDANDGQTSGTIRQKLAAKTYARSAAYDAAIANYFADKLADPAPAYRAQGGALKQALRYGRRYVTAKTRIKWPLFIVMALTVPASQRRNSSKARR